MRNPRNARPPAGAAEGSAGAEIWIVLFRGVGGATQLPIARLRQRLAEAGFGNVATYINSGNAVVASALPRQTVARRIAELARRGFGFEKDIHLRTRGEWNDLIANNPFPDAVATPRFLHAAVLAAPPAAGLVAALRAHAAEGERIEVVGEVACLHTPHGFGKSKLAERFDRGIGVANTARNWNTVEKLAALAAAAAANP